MEGHVEMMDGIFPGVAGVPARTMIRYKIRVVTRSRTQAYRCLENEGAFLLIT